MLACALASACRAPDPVAALDRAAPEDAAARVTRAWDRDPARTWALILAEPDEIARAALVTRLGSERPGAMAGRCDSLPPDASRARCLRLTLRPHLRSEGAHGRDPLERAGPGPASAWPPAADPPSPAPACAEGERDECLFRAAEALLVREGRGALGEALGLCAASAWAPQCTGHLLELWAPPVPPADAAGGEDLALARAAAEELSALAPEPRRGALWEDYLWSLWLGSAMDLAGEVRGDLAAGLPEQALPQLRFAAAWRLLRERTPGASFDLEPLAADLEAALGRRQELAPGRRAAALAHATPTRDGWGADRPGEGRVQAAFCLGSTRRAASPDPALDLRLALLEALFRQPKPPPAEAFLALLGDAETEAEDPLLRWSGARLGAALDPAAAEARLPEAADEPAMLRARLAPREGGSGKR